MQPHGVYLEKIRLYPEELDCISLQLKMESNKNNNCNNGGDKQPLRRRTRKRKLNKLENNGKPAAEGEDQPELEESSNKNSHRDGRNDPDLEQIVQLSQVQVTAQVQMTGEKEIAEDDENEEQAELPILQPMKIQLTKETWFDMLEFVGRHQLGQIVPEVGDRRFAGIAQPFLHNYGHITLENICIYSPRHRLIQHSVEIPENVKDFQFICLSYLNTPVISLLQKFQQSSLFGNVNLDLRLHPLGRRNELRETLSHILPSIDNINSIRGQTIAQLVGLSNANSDLAMAMLKMARFLDIFYDDFNFNYAPCEIAFLISWLQTPRDDGKPRVLVLPLDYSAVHIRFRSIHNIPHFIEGTIKLEFAKAKLPVCFFIRLFVYDTVDWHDSRMQNGETKEKLVIKKVTTTRTGPTNLQTMALISRYPLAAGKHWIEANEREAVDWNFDAQNGRICLSNSVINAIDNGDDNWPHNDDGRNEQGGNLANHNYGDQGRAYEDRRGRGMGRPIGFGSRGGRGGENIYKR